jgi:hypothetical protein
LGIIPKASKTIMNIANHSINEHDLLMLIILGCYLFSGIVKENDDYVLIVTAADASG